MCEMYDLSEEELENADFEACARAYLADCGMSEEEIDALQNLLEGK
jgi:hypothetical protein